MTSLEDFEDFDQEIHQRLLANDPSAPSNLVSVYLIPIMRWLQGRFPKVQDEAMIREAVLKAMLNYIENPSLFNPKRASLFSYLKMSAKGDLLNELERERVRIGREQEIKRKLRDEAVEQNTDTWDELQEDSEILIPEEYGTKQNVIRQVLEEFPDPLDRQLLQLMFTGKAKKTSACAAVLGIQDRNEVEQRRLVKQHKDRIKKRLERLGVKLRG